MSTLTRGQKICCSVFISTAQMCTNVIDMFLYQCNGAKSYLKLHIYLIFMCKYAPVFSAFFFILLDKQMCIKFDCDMFNTVQHRTKSDLILHFIFMHTQVHENDTTLRPKI